jgi:C-terminal processing protease CtpA/Prc
VRGTATLLALTTAALLAGCPGSDDSCTPEGKKETVLDLARRWYLFPDLLDPSVDPAAYADPESMLEALVAPARAAGKDKGWNFLTTASESETYYGAGMAAGFGVGLLVRDDSLGNPHLRVGQVFPGSAAADAGFARGDEILKIGTDAGTLAPVSEILAANGGWLGDTLGPPSTEGVTRAFEVQTVAGASAGTPPVTRTVTTRAFSLSPVAHDIVDGVGIILLRTFVSTADADLVTAMQAFEAAGVTKVIVDVRYNGGGLIATATVLANLLSAGHAGETMYTLSYSPAHASRDQTVLYAPTADAIQPVGIAFITTSSSASASELVPNALEPYFSGTGAPSIALVGATTYGKPVGQLGWTISSCGDVLYLVSFQLVNAQGDGGYFSGLPDAAATPLFSGPLCPAEDDLAHPQGDPMEASTAAALSWLASGTCPAPAGAAALSAAASVATPGPDRYPAPPRPSLAQTQIPGLF